MSLIHKPNISVRIFCGKTGFFAPIVLKTLPQSLPRREKITMHTLLPDTVFDLFRNEAFQEDYSKHYRHTLVKTRMERDGSVTKRTFRNLKIGEVTALLQEPAEFNTPFSLFYFFNPYGSIHYGVNKFYKNGTNETYQLTIHEA